MTTPYKDTTAAITWQQAYQNASLSAEDLLKTLRLDADEIQLSRAGLAQFGLRIPPAFLRQIRPGDPDDPLLRQVLSLANEDREVAGFATDPVGDLAAQKQPGLLHKYHGRVLLTLTGACAIHCRYCFRRHFPYAESNPAHSVWQKTLDYISNDVSLREVIFSGGDPLSLSDSRLASLTEDLQQIPHLKRLRIHSRMPVVVPERVTDGLLEWLNAMRLKPVIVVHTNHAQEIGAPAAAALQRLHHAGIHVLNQSVLLKGVNDTAAALIALSETLFDNHVLPYYVHMLDPVAGASHFAVDKQRVFAIYEFMRQRLPGYLLPKLVREVAGAPYKLPVL